MPYSGFCIVFMLLAVLAHHSLAGTPNILFIMSDDHCAQAVGAYGGRLAELNPTPTIDRLAREGMLFQNCFVTNSICTPSRACIMTGQYPHVNGVYDLNGRLEPARQFLAHEIKRAGYHTALIGKWHLEEEPAAFDYYKVLPGQGKYFDPDFCVRGQRPWPENVVTHRGQHSSDAITDIAIEWIKNGWDREKPFFLMHHYKAPHDFFEYAPRYEQYLADVQIPEPASLWRQPHFGSIATRGADDELLPYIGTSIGRRNQRRNYVKHYKIDAGLSDEDAKRAAYNIYLKHYLRCVKGIDDNLARLFGFLKEIGQLDNTVIIYTSDQGFMLGEHDYMDKRWMYDESQRIPFVIRYPKLVKAGSRSDAIIENVDFAATMLDFAGVEQTPDYMQGRDFRAICEHGKEPAGWRQAAYYRYWMHMAHHDNPAHVGVRTKDHKLIFYYGCDQTGANRTPPSWELYDLNKDPHEVINVYDDPRYAEVVDRLKQQLRQRRGEIGDTDEKFPEMKAIVDQFWDYDQADRKHAVQISNYYLARQQAAKTDVAE
jgi:N-acetylglucosamine-6-sulfatase